MKKNTLLLLVLIFISSIMYSNENQELTTILEKSYEEHFFAPGEACYYLDGYAGSVELKTFTSNNIVFYTVISSYLCVADYDKDFPKEYFNLDSEYKYASLASITMSFITTDLDAGTNMYYHFLYFHFNHKGEKIEFYNNFIKDFPFFNYEKPTKGNASNQYVIRQTCIDTSEY